MIAIAFGQVPYNWRMITADLLFLKRAAVSGIVRKRRILVGARRIAEGLLLGIENRALSVR